MIRSMTGYGKAQQIVDLKKVTVELKALNSKQLDLTMRLPSELKQLEFEIRNIINETIQRGKVDFTLTIEDAGIKKLNRIDKEVALDGFKQLQELAWELQFKMPEDVASVLVKFPGFFSTSDPHIPDESYQNLVQLALSALEQFDAFRLQEGKVLRDDMLQRIRRIEHLMQEIELFEPQRYVTLKARLMKGLNEAAENTKFDENRFEQELIYYIEKLDISEEKTRLKTHCEYFAQTIDEDNAGKKLGFISQEIGREINTLGSKANDASIQRIVVQMKDELEKVKEQLFNVL